MSADYGSATIAGVNSVGPAASVPVQPPIGWNTLGGGNTRMWNAHIGSAQAVSTTPADGPLVALQNTPARDNLNAEMRWATCVAGCAAAATGTLTSGVFVVGAGASVAKAAIPANGWGWVKV